MPAKRAERSADVNDRFEWAEFLGRHDLTWDRRFPQQWGEAPYFGNGLVGSMLYRDGERDRLRLQVFRSDVRDHRDNRYGWTAYSRPRLMIGSFYLEPDGSLQECDWRLDLWNAELTGTITTTEGTVELRHFVHAEDHAMVTEVRTLEGSESPEWHWEPAEAKTTRDGIPKLETDADDFADTYGERYRDDLAEYVPNPDPRWESADGVEVTVQDLYFGGQHAVAWNEHSAEDGLERHVVSIEKSYPQRFAREKAVSTVQNVLDSDIDHWRAAHREWWHDYYPESFLSVPDADVETLYWHQMYKLACTTRSDRPMIDTAGLWLQPTPWNYATWDLNIQLCYWPVYASNRLHLGESLLNTLDENRQALIDNVRPVEWQEDSAILPISTAIDLVEPRDGDMRYYDCVGNLPWALHNCWLHYQFSQAEAVLENVVFPLLKRAVNLYRHLLEEDDEGRLHLEPTYSPETGTVPDCNYDLALLRWGCKTLLEAADQLDLDDPLIPEWKDILERLTEYPTGESGFLLGRDKPLEESHRHYSHLLMIYPLFDVTGDTPEEAALIERSLEHWQGMEEGHAGFSCTGASHIASVLGSGDEALSYLENLWSHMEPNMFYRESGPVLETPLSAAHCVHDMLIQSWDDTIRVFPAVPSDWEEVTFRDLRARGAFLVSAHRGAGETQWIHIESLEGEPCHIEPNIDGDVTIVDADGEPVEYRVTDGVYTLDLDTGDTATLFTGPDRPTVDVTPLPADDSGSFTAPVR